MKKIYLQSLPEKVPFKVNENYIGFRFLEGESMINQKHEKKIGEIISVYRIIAVNKNSYEYKVEFERLED